MTHINHLPADDASLIKVPFDHDDPTTWPDTSYAGNERDLANMLDDDVVDNWYATMREQWDENYTSWALFNLLLMHKAAFLAMVDLQGNDPADALQLRLQVQADANENSGDYFATAIDYRLMQKRLTRKA